MPGETEDDVSLGVGLYIHPDHQRRGVGMALTYSQRELFGRGVITQTVPGTGAVEFNEKRGFEPTGRIYEAFPRLKGGEEMPQIELEVTADAARDVLDLLRKRFEDNPNWRFIGHR